MIEFQSVNTLTGINLRWKDTHPSNYHTQSLNLLTYTETHTLPPACPKQLVRNFSAISSIQFTILVLVYIQTYFYHFEIILHLHPVYPKYYIYYLYHLHLRRWDAGDAIRVTIIWFKYKTLLIIQIDSNFNWSIIISNSVKIIIYIWKASRLTSISVKIKLTFWYFHDFYKWFPMYSICLGCESSGIKKTRKKYVRKTIQSEAEMKWLKYVLS